EGGGWGGRLGRGRRSCDTEAEGGGTERHRGRRDGKGLVSRRLKRMQAGSPRYFGVRWGMSLTIWCNAALGEKAETLLVEGLAGHRVIFAKERSASVLVAGKSDEGFNEADVVFGQPDAAECL